MASTEALECCLLMKTFAVRGSFSGAVHRKGTFRQFISECDATADNRFSEYYPVVSPIVFFFQRDFIGGEFVWKIKRSENG